MSKRKDILITEEDLKFIFGDEYDEIKEKIFTNCYCSRCTDADMVTIVNYKPYISSLDDVVLKGKCKNCGEEIGRCIETGEVERFRKRVREVLTKYHKG